MMAEARVSFDSDYSGEEGASLPFLFKVSAARPTSMDQLCCERRILLMLSTSDSFKYILLCLHYIKEYLGYSYIYIIFSARSTTI